MLLVSSQTAEDHLEWCGLVESKVRYLVGNLERNPFINLAHVNPRCFDRTKQCVIGDGGVTDANDKLVTAPCCSMWFIGMEFKRTENLNVDLTDSIQSFTNLVYKHAMSINLQKDGMEIEARHLRRKQLSNYVDKELLNRDRKSLDTTTAASTTNSRKRSSTESQQNPSSKRTRNSESVRCANRKQN